MQERCDGVPLAEQAGSLIALLDRELGRSEAIQFRATPLTAAQFSVALALADGPRTSGELAAAVCCVPANITALVDRMEAKGLVRRLASQTDRRVTSVALTDQGRRALADTSARTASRYERLSAVLSEAELGSLVSVLGRLYESLAGAGRSTCGPGCESGGESAGEPGGGSRCEASGDIPGVPSEVR